MRVKIEVILECDDGVISKGYHEFDMKESGNLDDFAQGFVYAIPKHDLAKFDVVQFYRDKEIIGHGEN